MKRLFISSFLVMTLLVMTAGIAFAMDNTTVTGTVQSVELETNPTSNNTAAVVTILDANGTSQTVRIDLQAAETLGLVTIDPSTGAATVVPDAIGKVIEIDPSSVLEDDPGNENDNESTNDDTSEAQHPVGLGLSDFFSNVLGVDYESIMAIHEEGAGFGVIAQALWLTNNIDGDTATFEALVEARQSGDYSTIILADGSTPDNWGDVVKSLKKGNNLGSVMSGRAEHDEDEVTPEAAGGTQGSGNVNGNTGNNAGGNSQGNGSDNGNSNGRGNGNGNGQGNGGGNGQGNGHP